MPSAFQPNAFQNDSFQVSLYPPEPEGGESSLSATTILTIAGVQWTYLTTTLSIIERINGRNVFSVTVIEPVGGSRPEVNDEIILEQDGIRIFGGNLDSVDEIGFGGESLHINEFRITALDFNALADRRQVIVDLPEQTLKASLVTLNALYLAPLGVTLDPAQSDGPVLPAISYYIRPLTEILNELVSMAGPLMGSPQAVVWEVDYNKVLRAFGVLDAGHNAPFNAPGSPPMVVGDIRVTPSKTDSANFIYLLYGSGEQAVIDNLGTGNGATSVYTLNYRLNEAYGYVNLGGTIVGDEIVGGTNEQLGVVGSGLTWIWDPGTETVTRSSPVPNGVVILFPYTAIYPQLVTADGGASAADRVDRLYTRPEIFDPPAAQALANSLLQQASTTFKEVSYLTLVPGCHPGQTQTITDSKHGISGIHLITEVRIDDRFESQLRFEIFAVAGSGTVPESWLATYELWNRGGHGSSGPASAVAGTIGAVRTIRQSYYLGGNESLYVQSPAPDWLAADAMRVTIDATARGTLVGAVKVRLRAASGSVTARLRNLTDGLTAGTSAAVSSPTWTDAPFGVTLAEGTRVYELQVLPSLANTDVAAVGYFE